MPASNYLFTTTCRGNTVIYAYDTNLVVSTRGKEEVIPLDKIQSFSMTEPKRFQKIGSFRLQTAQSATSSIHWGFGVSSSYGAEREFFYDEIDIGAVKQLRDFIAGYPERQRKASETVSAPAVVESSPADELRKYKALWDDGIITAEEFAEKRSNCSACNNPKRKKSGCPPFSFIYPQGVVRLSAPIEG